MNHPRRVFRPAMVEVNDGPHKGLYQIHMGRPGKPRVYRMIGKQGLRRVGDPGALEAVSKSYGEKIASLRVRVDAERARRKKWWYRAKLRLGSRWAVFLGWLRRQFRLP